MACISGAESGPSALRYIPSCFSASFSVIMIARSQPEVGELRRCLSHCPLLYIPHNFPTFLPTSQCRVNLSIKIINNLNMQLLDDQLTSIPAVLSEKPPENVFNAFPKIVPKWLRLAAIAPWIIFLMAFSVFLIVVPEPEISIPDYRYRPFLRIWLVLSVEYTLVCCLINVFCFL